MTQTMLATLAIVIAGSLAMQQHTNRVHAEQAIMRKEISTQMLAVAIDRLEEIGQMAYDEATFGNTRIYDANSLTAPNSFNDDFQGNDVDDFDGVSMDTFRVSNNQYVWFELETTVTYANETTPDVSVGSRTKMKKATVRIWPKDTLGINMPGKLQVPDTVKLSQSFACGSWCDW